MAAPAEYLLPNHDGPWTLDDVLALPEDHSQRIELVDGMLIVSPWPSLEHQRRVSRINTAFAKALPAGYESLPGANVVFGGALQSKFLIPDVIVTTEPDAHGVYLPGASVVLVAEVISPSSRSYDTTHKHQLYAEAEVPYYLLVDPRGAVPSAVLFEFVRGDFREICRSADGVLDMERPFSVRIEL